VKSLLNALQEGRLVELPDAEKGKALEYLAHLIEAVPDLSGISELYEAMMAREKAQNTALGLGVACPHVRAPGEGELFCAVGWSPAGIDYGAPHGKKVHLVVMYYIPDAQKNVYLKEVSGLAGAIHREGGISAIASAEDIATVRERLLDWVLAALEASIPEAKARMIRLEARQAAVESAPAAAVPGQIEVFPALVVAMGDSRPIVLCQAPQVAAALEKAEDLGVKLRQQSQFDLAGFKLIHRSSTQYGAGRTLHEYLAIKLS
jgi:mannitol/fructose-specific phosphotransferase system IIA component (Ntr-type)